MNVFATALVFLLQETSAEEAYRKIEETLAKAKTVTLKYTWKLRPVPSKPFEGSGTLLLKSGGKAHLDLKFENPGGEHTLRLVSDGSKMQYSFEPPGKETPKIVHEDTPENIMDDLGIVRFGPFKGITYSGLTHHRPRGGELDLMVKKAYHLTDFGAGEDDGGAKTLTYKLRCYESEEGDVRLWYDPLSNRPLKREIRHEFWPVGGANGKTRTETHEEFTFDADIADEKFILPVEKPNPEVYRATDIGEPEGFQLKAAKDVRLVGRLEHGTLEYEGAGELAEAFRAYVAGMTEREWTLVSERIDGAEAVIRMRRYGRLCTMEFSKAGDKVRAILKVEPDK